MLFPKSKNVLLVSFGYFWLFGGYAAAQQYLVPLLALQGRTHLALSSLLTLYTAFLFANIFVPKLITILGLRFSLILGAVGFAGFITSVATNTGVIFIYLTSILAGIGSSLVWISGGEIVARSSEKNKHGSNLGFQASIYWLGSWLGIGLGGFFLEKLALEELFIYFLLAILLSIPFFFLIKIKNDNNKNIEEEKKLQFKYLFDKRLILLFPFVFSSFFVSGLGFSAINLIALSFGLGFVGILAIISQGSRIIGSFSSGFLADKVSKINLLYVIIFFIFLGIPLIFLTSLKITVILGVIILNIAHPSVYPVSLALLKEKIPSADYTKSLGVFFLYTGLGSVSALLTTLYFDPKISFIPGIIFLLLAIPSIYFFSRIK